MADLSTYGRSELTDPSGFKRAVVVPQFDKGEAERVTAQSGQITPYLTDALGAASQTDAGQVLQPDELNARYGVPGYLTFNAAQSQGSADYQSRAAARRQYYDRVASSYQLSGLDSFWQTLKGGAMDPVALPTYFFGLGEAHAGEAAGQGLLAMGRGRMILQAAGRVAAENTAYGAGLTAVDYDFKTAADEDFDFGNALDGLAINATVGAVLGGIGGHFRANRLAKARPDVQAAIESAATRHGVDAGDLARVGELESRLNPDAKNPASSAKGLFQFVDKTWNHMGGGDKTDPALSADRAASMMADNAAGLRQALGREPAGWELYLAHQQGLGGAKALLSAPEASAVDVLAAMHENGKPIGEAAARERILKNGGRADMTAGEFAGLWRDRFGGQPASLPAAATGAVPDAVSMLSPSERAGAYEAAVDRFMDNSPVDLSELLPTDRQYSSIETGEPVNMDIPARMLHADTAVTTRGEEVPVRYALVEARDLVTSHDNDMQPRADYPQALQERDRSRAGSIVENRQLEGRLNPRLLTRDVAAQGGAPIVGSDGVVQSGNGRTIALRRAAEEGGEAYRRYRAQLDSEGYDTSGMERPILVRVNTANMSHGDLIRFTRDANLDVVERKGASEQARVDASRLPASALDLLQHADVTHPTNRDFVQAFIRHVAPEQANALSTAGGGVSAEAVARIKASLMAKAYDSPWLIEKLFEDPDPDIKTIGKALQTVAPLWARLKALVADGRIAEEADVTPDLNSVIQMISQAQERRRPLRDVIVDRIDQTDMLSGDAISEAQLVFLHTLYRNEAFTQVRAAADIARAMEAYVRQAEDIGASDLFGHPPLEQAREALLNSADYAGIKVPTGDNRVFTVRPEKPAVAETDLFGHDAGQPQRPEPGRGGGQPADGSGRRGPAVDAADKPKVNAQSLIAADPELKALQDDVERAEAEAGVTPQSKNLPETIADAMRAAAFCLLEGGKL